MKFVKVEQEMLEELYQWRKDPFAVKHNPFFDHGFNKFVETMNGCSSDFNEIYSGKDIKLVLVESNEILALVGLSQINKMMKTAEIGYQVSPHHRNKGIGTKAVNNFINMIFSKTDLRKVIATIADGNLPSCKVVENIGFIQEGLLRKHYLVNGIETDERIYGLLRSEYEK
ncbi:MAG: GNAT family protein [Bacteriovoracaceae bacterium]|jgi:RimJ/RimL family protein N-acetyltransferase|nr:GNAT family protein [Bacteriovoracaceae bacterium]